MFSEKSFLDIKLLVVHHFKSGGSELISFLGVGGGVGVGNLSVFGWSVF